MPGLAPKLAKLLGTDGAGAIDVQRVVRIAGGEPDGVIVTIADEADGLQSIRLGSQGDLRSTTLPMLFDIFCALHAETIAVIADGERAVALGGVMGGGNSEIDEGMQDWRDLFDEKGYYWVPLRPDQVVHHRRRGLRQRRSVVKRRIDHHLDAAPPALGHEAGDGRRPILQLPWRKSPS